MVYRFPSDIIAKEFIPTLRQMLITELRTSGLTQSEIATYIGVTQPSVSGYLDDPDNRCDKIADHPATKRAVEQIATGIRSGELSTLDVFTRILELRQELIQQNVLCELHEPSLPELDDPTRCTLCLQTGESELLDERAVLRSLRQAIQQFTERVDPTSLPSVGTNIGMALSDPTNEADVAALPGRLHGRRQQSDALPTPTFGASTHISSLLLAADEVDSNVRSALNIRTQASFIAAAIDRGYQTREFDAAADTHDRLRTLFVGSDTVPTICYHTGASGIEPITYVLGPTATAVVDCTVELFAHADSRPTARVGR